MSHDSEIGALKKKLYSRLEQELRRLKGELQASRQSEQELRSHVCNLTNSERSLRPEVSLLRQSNMLLQSK